MTQVVSPLRMALQLLERGFYEQQQQQIQQQQHYGQPPTTPTLPQYQQHQQQPPPSASMNQKHEKNSLFWEDPAVVARIMTECWRREARLAAATKQNGETTTDNNNNNNNESNPVTTPEISASTVSSSAMSVTEVQEWLDRNQPHLPEAVRTTWTDFWTHHQQRHDDTGFSTSWERARWTPTTNISGTRLVQALERLVAAASTTRDNTNNDSDDEKQQGVTRSLHVLNNALKDVKCRDKGRTHLQILDLLWKIPHLQPTRETYHLVFEGIVRANLQHGVYSKTFNKARPMDGTAHELVRLYFEMWDKQELLKQEALDNNETVSKTSLTKLSPSQSHLYFILDTMEQEESAAYGDDAWDLWMHNLKRRSNGEFSVVPTGALAEKVLCILARTNVHDDSNDDDKEDELARRAESIRQFLLEEREREEFQDYEESSSSYGEFGVDEDDNPQGGSSKDGNPTPNQWDPRTPRFWDAYIKCLTKNGNPAYLELAGTILDKDEGTMMTQEEGLIRPTNKLYGYVLRGWARAGNTDRIQSLFLSMMDSDHLQPDTKTILDAAIAMVDDEALSVAEKGQRISVILTKAAERTSVEPGKGENSSSTERSLASHLLRMLSTAKQSKDAKRAEIILQCLLHQQEVSDALELSVEDYSSVITAQSRSSNGIPNAPQRAESILMELIRRSDQDVENQSLQPPEHAFTSTIACWGRTKSKDDSSATRAQNIFDLLVNRYHKGKSQVQPSCRAYTALIHAWGNAGKPSRAEHSLNQMLSDYDSGNESAKPDLVAFNSVLSAWERASRQSSKHSEGSEANRNDPYTRSCAIVQLMNDLKDSSSFEVVPDATSYATVIGTLIHSDRSDRDVLARQWLQESLDRHKAGFKQCRPTPYMYGAMIQVLSKTLTPDAPGSVDLALEMEHYLDQLLMHPEFDGRQVMFAYDAVLLAWMKLAAQVPEAVDHAQALFERLDEVSAGRRKRQSSAGTNQQYVQPDGHMIFKLLMTYVNSCNLEPQDRQGRARWVQEKMSTYRIRMSPTLQRLLAECNV